jgi:hypothetical protein
VGLSFVELEALNAIRERIKEDIGKNTKKERKEKNVVGNELTALKWKHFNST